MQVAWATKGFEADSGKLPHQVAREVLGAQRPVAVLSGPTFAREVGAGLPTAMTIASSDAAYAQELARDLSLAPTSAPTPPRTSWAWRSAARSRTRSPSGPGSRDGLGFGANTRVALITRGLEEMTRLGVALGAQRGHLHGTRGPRRPRAHLHG